MSRNQSDTENSSDSDAKCLMVGGHNLRKRTPSKSPDKNTDNNSYSTNREELRRRRRQAPVVNGNHNDQSQDEDDDEQHEETADSHIQNESVNLSRLSSDFSRTTLNESLYPNLEPFKVPTEPKGRSPNKGKPHKRLSTQSPLSSRVPLNLSVDDDLSTCFNQTPAALRHPHETRHDHSANTETFSWNWFCFVMLICTAVVIYISSPYLFSLGPGMVNQDVSEVADRLDGTISNMRTLFPSQPTQIWKLIKSSLRRHLMTVAGGDLPHYPAVILLVANSSDNTLSCLSRKLGQQLGKIGVWSNPDCSEINLNSWRASVPGILKLRLDEQITSLYEGSTRCVVLTQLEGIPAEGAKMLHSFCDTEFAPYKDLVLIMTLHMTEKDPLPDVTSISSDAEWVAIDGLVEQRLKDLWERDLGVVEMAAVLSRIGNAIVPLASESLNQLEIACLN